MSKLIEILKYALKDFFPTNSQELEGEYYPSKKEMYRNWLNSQYINGSWYIGDELNPDDIVATLQKELKDGIYLVEGDGKYSLGFRVDHTSNNQMVKVEVVFDNDEQKYYYEDKPFEANKPYFLIHLNDEITPSNIKSITISSEEVVENYIKYLPFPNRKITEPQKELIIVSGAEYDTIRTNHIILQKLANIQCMNYKTEENGTEYYGLRLRNILPVYYSDKQTLKVEYNGVATEDIASEDTISLCCFNERPIENIEFNISLTSFEEYTGFNTKVSFNTVNGNSYTDSSGITYINNE